MKCSKCGAEWEIKKCPFCGEKFLNEIRKDDLPNSKSKMTYANGDVYYGELRNGKRHGKGKMTYANDEFIDNEVYDGEWKNGKKHGKGKMIYENGDVYDGEWEGGQRQGKGILKFVNGDVYIGEFENGVGKKGLYFRKNGSVDEYTYNENGNLIRATSFYGNLDEYLPF